MKNFSTSAILLIVILWGSANLTAQTMSAGCVITPLSTPKPVEVTDCDGSQTEKVDWEIPTAEINKNCGPLTTTHITGPAKGIEIGIGEYEIAYSFMAIDLAQVKMVNGQPDMSTVKAIEAKTSFILSVLPKDITPPVIAPLKTTSLSKKTVPDLKAMISATDNCTATAELVITQSVAPDTKVTDRTEVKVTVTDKAGNASDVTVTITK
jgi:hypothetical protein